MARRVEGVSGEERIERTSRWREVRPPIEAVKAVMAFGMAWAANYVGGRVRRAGGGNIESQQGETEWGEDEGMRRGQRTDFGEFGSVSYDC